MRFFSQTGNGSGCLKHFRLHYQKNGIVAKMKDKWIEKLGFEILNPVSFVRNCDFTEKLVLSK